MTSSDGGSSSAGQSTSACPSLSRPGLKVTVRNTQGNSVCDALVTATDGHWSETIPRSMTLGACEYVGLMDRHGTYAVTVSAVGYKAQDDVVEIPPAFGAQCSTPVTQERTYTLELAQSPASSSSGASTGGSSSGSCPSTSRPGLRVTVNSPTGGTDPLCHAVVTVTADGFSEDLALGMTNGLCTYSGLWNRPGTYTVTARADMYVTQSQTVVVPAAYGTGCDVPVTQELTFTLQYAESWSSSTSGGSMGISSSGSSSSSVTTWYSSCVSLARPGLKVTVSNTVGQTLCDATVTVTGEDYTETLPRDLSQGVCTYTGLWNRLGTYTVTVNAVGYVTQSNVVVVPADPMLGCVPATQERTYTLEPVTGTSSGF